MRIKSRGGEVRDDDVLRKKIKGVGNEMNKSW
jgi:hypothetical protein